MLFLPGQGDSLEDAWHEIGQDPESVCDSNMDNVFGFIDMPTPTIQRWIVVEH